MNYKNSAKVCMYNYFRDFGYKEDINKLDEIVNLDNCDNPLEFIKKLESINIKATISALPLDKINHDINIPYFAICEIERGKSLYLPVYRIEPDFIVLKDSNGKTIRVKTSLFSKIYQGKIIQITDNKKFLKEHFFKKEYKKRLIFGIPTAISFFLFIASVILFIIGNLTKEKFIDSVNAAVIISVFVFGILFAVFLPFFLRYDIWINTARKGRNKQYDDGHYYGYYDSTIRYMNHPNAHEGSIASLGATLNEVDQDIEDIIGLIAHILI